MKNGETILVSVIMPFYNAETTIVESIRSVLSQDFTKWELILYNDSSTDNSCERINTFLSDPRIHLIHNQSNTHGPSHSRNACVAESSGEYLAFLDADDLWLPNYLSSRLDAFSIYPEAVMIYGPATYFSDNDRYLQDCGIEGNKLYKAGELFLNFIKNIKGTPCPSGSCVLKSVFLQIGGFDRNLLRGEDIAFFLCVNKDNSIYFDKTPLFLYRRHHESSTSRSNRNGDRFITELIFYEWLIDFTRNNKIGQALFIAQSSWMDNSIKLYGAKEGNLKKFAFLRHCIQSKLNIDFKLAALLFMFFSIRIAKGIRYRALLIMYK